MYARFTINSASPYMCVNAWVSRNEIYVPSNLEAYVSVSASQFQGTFAYMEDPVFISLHHLAK